MLKKMSYGVAALAIAGVLAMGVLLRGAAPGPAFSVDITDSREGEGIDVLVTVQESGLTRRARHGGFTRDEGQRIISEYNATGTSATLDGIVKGLYQDALTDARLRQILDKIRTQQVDSTTADGAVPKPSAAVKAQVIQQQQTSQPAAK